MVAKRFPGKNVGYVDFDYRGADRRDGIREGDRSMRICPGIKDNPIIAKPYLVDLVYKRTFVVALKIGKRDFRIFFLQLFEELLEGSLAIDPRFAQAKQVKVGAIDNDNPHIRMV